MNETIRQYCCLVDFLGKTLGPDYEIALHDLTEGNYSIVAIANGFNSHRQVGAPLTKKALSFVESGIYKTQDSVLQYAGAVDDKTRTVSSTMFIKDPDGTLIGMLCINYNTASCAEAVRRIMNLFNLPSAVSNEITGTPASSDNPEVFTNSVSDLVSSILEQALPAGTPAARLNQNEKIEIIKILKEHGVFAIKGAVHETAAQLACSEPTVYRYLKNL